MNPEIKDKMLFDLKVNMIDFIEHNKIHSKAVKLVYISGPITGMDDLNRKEFEKYKDIVNKSGHRAINPHDLTKHLDTSKWSWEDFMTVDLPFLLLSSTIICLDGWQSSKGARLEIATAYFMKKEILLAKDMKPLEYHFELKPIMKSFLTGRS